MMIKVLKHGIGSKGQPHPNPNPHPHPLIACGKQTPQRATLDRQEAPSGALIAIVLIFWRIAQWSAVRIAILQLNIQFVPAFVEQAHAGQDAMYLYIENCLQSAGGLNYFPTFPRLLMPKSWNLHRSAVVSRCRERNYINYGLN